MKAEDEASDVEDDDPLLLMDLSSRRNPWDNRPMRVAGAFEVRERVAPAQRPVTSALRMPEPSISSLNREVTRDERSWVTPILPLAPASAAVEAGPGMAQQVFGVSNSRLAMVVVASMFTGAFAAFVVYDLITAGL